MCLLTYFLSHREILKADACAVHLYKFNLFYYEFGMRLAELDNSESAAITVILKDVSMWLTCSVLMM